MWACSSRTLSCICLFCLLESIYSLHFGNWILEPIAAGYKLAPYLFKPQDAKNAGPSLNLPMPWKMKTYDLSHHRYVYIDKCKIIYNSAHTEYKILSFNRWRFYSVSTLHYSSSHRFRNSSLYFHNLDGRRFFFVHSLKCWETVVLYV